MRCGVPTNCRLRLPQRFGCSAVHVRMNQSVVIGIVAYAQPGISSLGLLTILFHSKVPVVSVVGNARAKVNLMMYHRSAFPYDAQETFSAGGIGSGDRRVCSDSRWASVDPPCYSPER